MKKILWATLIVATFFAPNAGAQAPATPPPPGAAAAAPGAAPAPGQGRKKRVAVFDFDFTAIPTATIAQLGNNVDVGKGITDLLVKYLVQDGTYSVIERNALDKIMAEQNFSNSDRANPDFRREDRQTAGRRRDHRRQHHAIRERHEEYRRRRRRRRLWRHLASAASRTRTARPS